jgi:predicted nucleic acid-binding protein
MRVLFDLNVVLDLVLDRAPWSGHAKALAARLLQGQIEGYVCSTSVPTLFYIVRKSAGADPALLSVQRVLQTFEIAGVGRSVLETAALMSGADFEDHVQTAAAEELGLDIIVTRDQAGFSVTKLRVAAPDVLEAELAGQSKPHP